jgi:hypothetical protein
MSPRKINLLEKFSNIEFEKEISLLFGEGSNVKINSVKFSTQRKTYLIDTTINVTNIDHSPEAFPWGLEHIISESCKFFNFVDNPIILSSIKLKE